MKKSCVQWVAKELTIVLPNLSDSDLQYNLRQGWRHAFNGYCDHCSWKKLNNWLQCRSSLRCCNQSVHVYQNCLEQSQKHVCDGAYDHYNYMETRLKAWSPYSLKDRKRVYQRAYYSSPGVDCKNLLWEISYYRKHALPCEKAAS